LEGRRLGDDEGSRVGRQTSLGTQRCQGSWTNGLRQYIGGKPYLEMYGEVLGVFPVSISELIKCQFVSG